MTAWNSQMALDARQYLFFKDAQPIHLWRVENSEGKEFILKLYRVKDEMNSVRAGEYIESKYLDGDDDFNPNEPEAGTEWAFVESSVKSILNHYDQTKKISVE